MRSLIEFWKSRRPVNPDASSTPSFVIAGLGNPGERYTRTRHNIGFQVVEALADAWRGSWRNVSKLQYDGCRHDSPQGSVLLVKPQAYMNASGQCLQKIASFYKLKSSNFICAYDDITLPVGKTKLSLKGGDGGHNGVADVIKHLGSGFIRFRVGIGPKKHPGMDLKDHVLGRIPDCEQLLIEKSLPEWCNQIQLILDKGPQAAMNQINRN